MVVNNRGDLSNGLPPDEQLPDGDSELRPKHDRDRATELELVDAALLGDMQAFSNLLEHYRSDLYGFCLRRLDDASLAEDVVQEVFIKALTNLPIFDRSKRVWPWLATIASRLCIDLQRRRSFIHYSGNIGTSVDTGKNGYIESVLDSVIASEERAELWKSLDILPMRQRRAFVLYEVDGLSCADIAAAEGISVGAVKLLLFRARKKMRSLRQSGPLPAIVFPFTWLGWKLQRIGERIRIVLGVYSDGFSTACVQAVCLSAVAMMVVTTGNSAESLNGNDAMRFDEAAVLATQSRPLQTASPRTALPYIGAPAKAPVDSQQSVADTSSSPVDAVINPNQNATPENTHFTSITASPNYESDHTILALGSRRDGVGYVVFVSYDSGASWKPLPSRLLLGHTAVLPPDYPQDRRIFSLGEFGLQQSDDGGENFRTVSPKVSPSSRGIAISPLFGRGDSRVLLGDKVLQEYDADTGVTRPALLAISLAWDVAPSIAFSPDYGSDLTVFLSDDGFAGSTLYRCKGSVCDKTRFPFFGLLRLRISPRFDQDALAYAFTYSKLLVSTDGVRTFRESQFPLQDLGYIHDVAVLWKTSSDPAIFVSVYDGFTPGVYRSLDAGRSWNRTWIDLPGFSYAEKLIVTPTGRLLAVGMSYGIACSEDYGQTWAPRCSPE